MCVQEPPTLTTFSTCCRGFSAEKVLESHLPSKSTNLYLPLSARVRGNQFVQPPHQRHHRSIPASAGEPTKGRAEGVVGEVYPRECGGTVCIEELRTNICGLSPRVRGNRGGGHRRRHPPRSIPASAGEPTVSISDMTFDRVYPRECGGTKLDAFQEMLAAGLSPRVRGNRLPPLGNQQGNGSIPASAGEPTHEGQAFANRGVYPRECGGTRCPVASQERPEGLSPRVRGNLEHPAVDLVKVGSIPASAGEPGSVISALAIITVYPRECGGTGLSPRVRGNPWGLSPRVRGNR